MYCPNINSGFFKNLVNTLDIHPENLEQILHIVDKDGSASNKEVRERVKNYIKEGSTMPIEDETSYREALALYETYTDDGYIEAGGKRAAESFYALFTSTLGEENVIRYNNAKGKPVIRVAKPVLKSESDSFEEEETTESEINPFNEAKTFVDILKKFSKEHIKFEKKDHKYTVDGEPAVSVTQYIYGKKDIGAWGVPSSAIGNTVDALTRDFFSGNLKKSYPNLSKEGLESLIEDLQELQKSLDKRFGGRENYKVVTDEFYISSKFITYDEKTGKPTVRNMAGTMDMLVYDKEGNFYIYDMKAKRSGISEKDLNDYSKQLSLYKSILEANFPELKGKIKELKLIEFRTFYGAPKEKGGEVTYTVDEETNQLYADKVPIQESKNAAYKTPELISTLHSFLVDAKILTFKEEFEALDSFDRELLEEEVGKPVEQSTYKPNELNNQKNSLYNNPLLNAEERSFLASSVMKMTSFIITQLQTNPKASKKYFGTTFNADFTKMSRAEIIEVVGINNIFDYIKEEYFNSDNREDLDDIALQKLDIAYNNWEALKQEGYATLITLEDISVIKADRVLSDAVEAQLAEDADSGNNEQHEREYWQVNFRQISSRASLSTVVRRALERLQIMEIDEDGNLVPVLDDTFGLPTYVDSGIAVNSILEWCKDCDTISEMEEVLKDMVSTYPWLAPIIGIHEDGIDYPGLIEEEPFRSQFYSNFRRDFTQYSTVIVEFDEDGNRRYVTHIINTKGATQALLDSVVNAFQEGLMPKIITSIRGDIEGRGRVNRGTVERLLNEWDAVVAHLSKDSSSERKFKKAITLQLPIITGMLNTLGILVTPENVEALLLKDHFTGHYHGSNVQKVLKKINDILSTLKDNYDSTEYNPMIKGEKGNLYSDYKDIINMFSKFVQDGIESSTYENGKMYYSFQTPSYMGKLIRELKDSIGKPEKFDKFIEEKYKKYRWFYDSNEEKWYNKWLESIVNKQETRSALEHKVQLSLGGTDYRDLSEIGYTLSLMSEYFYDRNGKWAWYRVPILSNKPSSEFIKFERHKFNRLKSGIKGKKKILTGLVATAQQEIIRIRTVLDTIGNTNISNWSLNKDKYPDLYRKISRRKEIEETLLPEAETSGDKKTIKALNKELTTLNLTFDDLVKDGKLVTSGSGAEFKFMQALNSELINKTELGQMILEEINGIEHPIEWHSTFVQSLKEAINNDMDLIVEREIDNWKNIGLFEQESQDLAFTEGKGKNKKSFKVSLPRYKYLQSFMPSVKEVFTETLKDMDIESLEEAFDKKGVLKPEIAEAYEEALYEKATNALEEYVWNDLFATINIIELTATDLAYFKNVEDFQKRYAAVHSPGIRMNIEAKDAKGVLYSKDGKCRVLHLKDSIETSDIIENVRQVFNQKIASLSSKEEKQSMQKMRDLILSGFEKINVTDGQAYSSPTSYRKKMGMLGRWTSEEEKAYEEIRKGNFTVENLGIVWQPLKPFIYTQMNKTTGSDIMPEIKTAMQVKDSEYMLLLADAIIRGGNKKNKLTALFDFMEDTAYDGRVSKDGKVIKEGSYNGIGIDTIAFVSTSKFGSMEVVDISNSAIREWKNTHEDPNFSEKEIKAIENMSDYEVMKAMLNESAYFNDEHVEDADNNMGRYNDQFVHEFSFEEYALQQEVPNHFKDHNQAMGSQIRILNVSDINPNESFNINKESVKGSELVKEYQELIAENIKDSFNALIKAFNIDSTDKFKRNKAIESLLTETILKDQRYGNDLLRACTLNDQGEFTIPLCDPIQSIRIQQLINSLIKSRINKQLTKGGPVVQTSVFGMSDDLHIRFKDKNGNLLMTLPEFKNKYKYDIDSEQSAISQYREYVQENQGELAYWEVYMPVPSETMEKALIEAGKKNGKDYFNNVEEAIKDGIIASEMLNAIGYRIPTEDKYSMAPMRVKGFMPRAAGEALMMPKEVTYLTGSDFDIDKMYIMMKEFSQNDYYNLEEAWEDYYTNSSEGKEARKAIDAQKEKVVRDALTNMSMSDNPEQYEDFLKLDEKEFRKAILKEAAKQGFDKDYKWVTDVQKSFSKWFNKEQKEKHKQGIKFREIKSRNNRAGRNNRIFDLQWAVLTGSDTLSKMFNPGSFDVQKKSARIINILKDPSNKYKYRELASMTLEGLDKISEASSNRNILMSSTQVYFHKQNMTAGKLIGIFANNNTSHAFVALQNIYMNLDDTTGFCFDGDTVMMDKLDRTVSRDKTTLVSKNIAGYLAASVDAVKDPVLNFLNLNTFTAAPAMVLIRLGFDVDSVSLLMTQPIIEKAVSEYFKRSNEGYVSQDAIINELKQWIKDNYNYDSKVLEGDLVTNEFTKDEMAENLGIQLNKMSGEQAEFQLKALMLFQRLVNIANQMQTLTFLTKFNSVTNAPGPTIADSLVMRERYLRFKKLFDDKINLFSDNAVKIIDNSPILKAFYDTTIADGGASQKIFSPFFPHYSASFSAVLEKLSNYMKVAPDAKIINKLVNDYVLYKLTWGENPVIDFGFKKRRNLIYAFPETYMEKSKAVINNPLFNITQIKARDRKCPVPTIEAKTGGFNASMQETIKNSWATLIQNPNTHGLGVTLFFYNILRSGFGFSPKTFTHLASVDVKLNIDGYVEALRDPDFNNIGIDHNIDDFIIQFLRNHCKDYRLVPSVKEDKKLKVSYSEDTLTFSFKKEDLNKGLNPSFLLNTSNVDDRHLSPVIWYRNKLYMMPQDFIDDGETVTVSYTNTTPLGNTNNFLEYDANDSNGAFMQTAMTQPIEREDEKDDAPSKDSGEYKEETPIERWSKLDSTEQSFLLHEVFTSAELDELEDIKGKDAKIKKYIDLVFKHLKSARGEAEKNRAVDRNYRQELEEIVKKLC